MIDTSDRVYHLRLRPVEPDAVTMPRDSDPRTVQVIDRKRTDAGKRLAGAG